MCLFYKHISSRTIPKEIANDFVGQVIDFIQFQNLKLECITQKALSDILFVFIFKTDARRQEMMNFFKETEKNLYIECVSLDSNNGHLNNPIGTVIIELELVLSFFFLSFCYARFLTSNRVLIFCHRIWLQQTIVQKLFGNYYRIMSYQATKLVRIGLEKL